MYELISIFVLAFGYCRDMIEERAYDKGFGTLNMYLYQEDFMVLAAPSANKETRLCLSSNNQRAKRP